MTVWLVLCVDPSVESCQALPSKTCRSYRTMGVSPVYGSGALQSTRTLPEPTWDTVGAAGALGAPGRVSMKEDESE